MDPRSSGSQVQLYIPRTYHYIVYQDQTEAFHQDHQSGPRSNLQTDADLGDRPPKQLGRKARKKNRRSTSLQASQLVRNTQRRQPGEKKHYQFIIAINCYHHMSERKF